MQYTANKCGICEKPTMVEQFSADSLSPLDPHTPDVELYRQQKLESAPRKRQVCRRVNIPARIKVLTCTICVLT